MKYIFILLFFSPFCLLSQKTIHIYVALCDNEFQGIVPVPQKIGNGKDPFNNLYWGAAYGIKIFFKRSSHWSLVKTFTNPETNILERCLFKHKTKDVFLLADAYDGEFIQECTSDFIESMFSMNSLTIEYENRNLSFAKDADLVSYIGHNGLMDFDLEKDDFEILSGKEKEVIVLACISQAYFAPFIKKSCANPLLLTANLMAPEAYSIEAALESWLSNETDENVRLAAARAYSKYQKCSMYGAKKILVTGLDGF